MPTIEQNLHAWGKDYDWSQEGNDWSKTWGGPEAQWFGTIYPRIHSFVPARRILEIAPGFGRWTQFLKNYSEELAIVDLTPACIKACKERFQAYSHIAYHVNDGKSLDMIADKSIDFAFSFDSLVHVEADVIEAYLDQLARKLNDNAVGFIHHSNIGSYVDEQTGKLSVENSHWRGVTVRCDLFEKFCDRAGLQCLIQELVGWDESDPPVFTDCLSVFTPKSSIWARPNVRIPNGNFMWEAKYIKHLAGAYAFDSSTNRQPRS